MYAIYSTVSANRFAGIDHNFDQPIGTQYFNITRAYPPNYLMTVPGGCDYHEVGRKWSTLRIIDLTNPPQNWISDQGCFFEFDGGVHPYNSLGEISPNGTEMAASPMLSFPPDIMTLDPSWTNCQRGAFGAGWGIFDPPRALTPVGALVPSATKNPPQTSSPFTSAADPADPGGAPTTASVIKTTMPTQTPLIPTIVGQDSTGTNQPSTLEALLAPQTGASSYPKFGLSAAVATTIGAQSIYAPPVENNAVKSVVTDNRGSAVTLDNIPVYVDPHGSNVGDSIILPPSQSAGLDPAPFSLRGQPIKIDAASGVVIGDETVASGHQTTISGNYISVGSDRMVIGSKTYAMPVLVQGHGSRPVADNWPPSVYGEQISADRDGAIVFGGSTIAREQETDIYGTHVSVGSDRVIVGSSTYKIRQSNSLPADETKGLGSLKAIPGASPIPQTSNEGHQDGFIFFSSMKQALSVASNGAIVIDQKSFSNGAETTVSGTVVSIGSGSMVIGGSTYPLPSHTSLKDPGTLTGASTIPKTSNEGHQDGSIFFPSMKQALSVASNGAIVIDQKSLSNGAETTVSGTVVSIGSGLLVIGGSTYPLQSLTSLKDPTNPTGNPDSKTTEALGAVIASMFAYTPSAGQGNSPSSGSETVPATESGNESGPTSSLVLFTGNKSKLRVDRTAMMIVTIISISVNALIFPF